MTQYDLDGLSHCVNRLDVVPNDNGKDRGGLTQRESKNNKYLIFLKVS